MGDVRGFRLTDRAPERYERYAAPVMAPFVAALLDAVALGPGAVLLDVACGTGFVARAAAGRTAGTGARIVGVDLVPGMLETAAARAAAEGVVIEWQEAEAGDLPYAGDTFDSVVCQQGVQFFPDRPAAVAEAARVVRPGGRVAVTAWAPMDRSPLFAAQQRAFEEFGGPGITDWYAADFSCGAAELTALLRDAGLTDVTAHEVIADVALPPLAAFVPGFLTVTPWGQALVEARPDNLDRAATRITELLAPWTTGDGSAQVEFVSYLVTGVRQS
ncbi:class I SAM-dependent methyltransferase [Streptomyces qinzhouensis]|uniref:Methyltransferase domain-containing protein n=1 Tax=Streptomyces qinzhouensis TaxID=2599401 RepID=A0A5B8JIU1_9ACTN|nr:class I SAM-dependent methyltransferase [Streptomyces qinzhouensis]QDY77720.1 methyltransferase domain-containing protein [Streptomyces qinzhouensis]